MKPELRKIDLGSRDRLASEGKPKPALTWVPITDLRIDDSYQRPIHHRGWKQIEWIAANFNWASFSPVVVSIIAKGLYALIDGQHRAHAAFMAGHDQIPAFLVEIDQAEQAAAFARINGRITRLTPHAIFKAALVAQEKWALECDRVVSEGDCRLMRSNRSSTKRKPGEIYIINAIRDMVYNFEGEAVTAGLRALRHSVTGSDVDAYTQQMLKPWLQAVASNSAYLHIDLLAALNHYVDLFLLYEWATKQSKETRESRPLIFRQMICSALDKFRDTPGAKVVQMKRTR